MARQRHNKRAKKARRRAARRTDRVSGDERATRSKSSGWRAILPPGAPSAEPLRSVYRTTLEELEGEHEAWMAREMKVDLDGLGIAPGEIVQAPDAWPLLEAMHADWTGRALDVARGRGGAEWLWFLRRLRGQFHINSLDSTDPYVQLLAEVLATAEPRPSDHLSDRPSFEYAVDAHVLIDLISLRHAAIRLYRLQATMRRCAKGQHVEFTEADVPYAMPDVVLEPAIEEFDRRSERASASLFDAVGLHMGLNDLKALRLERFGGEIPWWFLLPTPRSDRLIGIADPAPAYLDFADLERAESFESSPVLTSHHVALIALLWASWNIITRDPHKMSLRIAAPLQWAYLLTHTENFLHEALDEALQWMRNEGSPVLVPDRIPSSPADALVLLTQHQPSFLPPLPGSPVHESGELTVVDLRGASHLLFETMRRPPDGAGANVWADQFETDVQGLIDQSPWRPEGELRGLIRAPLHRVGGDTITDIDAVAVRDGQLLLVSCKSFPHTVDFSAGSHQAVRNLRTNTEKAIADWDLKMEEIRATRDQLRPALPAGYELHGLVVLPTIPFIVDAAARRPKPPLDLPSAVSTGEFAAALESRRLPSWLPA